MKFSVPPTLDIEVHRHSVGAPWTYAMLEKRQNAIAHVVFEEGLEGKVIISEVSPVVTIGRRTDIDDLIWEPEAFQNQGVEILNVDRGGLATYHGPGQWVLFVVESLEKLTGDTRGVQAAVFGLLEVAKRAAEKFSGEKFNVRAGKEQGLWNFRGEKVASVGVHVRNGVLLHGICVNGYKTERSFAGIRPCGLESPMGYLISTEDIRARNESFGRLGKILLEETFETGLNAQKARVSLPVCGETSS